MDNFSFFTEIHIEENTLIYNFECCEYNDMVARACIIILHKNLRIETLKFYDTTPLFSLQKCEKMHFHGIQNSKVEH